MNQNSIRYFLRCDQLSTHRAWLRKTTEVDATLVPNGQNDLVCGFGCSKGEAMKLTVNATLTFGLLLIAALISDSPSLAQSSTTLTNDSNIVERVQVCGRS